MDDQIKVNDPEANEAPENKFACLGVTECQQILERLRGGVVVDELPYAVKALLKEYEHAKDVLRREVGQRKSELDRPRNRAVELHIAKKYAQAVEAYDEYFAVLGSQVTDYEAEQQKKECLQYVKLAKKKKLQTMAAVAVVLVLCGVAVDQVLLRQNINAFEAALLERDYETATDAAIKISWRYDTEAGISNLVSFLDVRNEFSQLCGEELVRASLDNYGGLKWVEILALVEQADANEDLPQGTQQVRQAVEMTADLVGECEVLEKMVRDYNAMYRSCNHMDADHYAHEKWTQLQHLRAIEITQTNLNVIAERYELMVGITNRVAMLMGAQKDMEPVKEEFEQELEKEQIAVQKIRDYTSHELEKAKELAAAAQGKEEVFEFADAWFLYTRALEHIKASQEKRKGDAQQLARIDQAQREFSELYKTLDEDLAKERFPDDFRALTDQKLKAEAEYNQTERWNGNAYVAYTAAVEKLKKLKGMLDSRFAKEEFELRYGKLDVGLADRWFPDQWDSLGDQKKKAEAAAERGDRWADVNACYEVALSKLDLLEKSLEGTGKVEESKAGFNQMFAFLEIGLAEKWFPEQWSVLRAEKKTADGAYASGGKLDDVINHYGVASQILEDLLVEMSRKAKKDFDDMNANISGKIKGILQKNYPEDWKKLEEQMVAAEAAYDQPRNWESDASRLYIAAARTLYDVYNKGQEEKKFINFAVFDMSDYEEAMKPVSEYQSSGSTTNEIPH